MGKKTHISPKTKKKKCIFSLRNSDGKSHTEAETKVLRDVGEFVKSQTDSKEENTMQSDVCKSESFLHTALKRGVSDTFLQAAIQLPSVLKSLGSACCLANSCIELATTVEYKEYRSVMAILRCVPATAEEMFNYTEPVIKRLIRLVFEDKP